MSNGIKLTNPEFTSKTVLPCYCENMSRKKGKKRCVSRNTPTPNRLSTKQKNIFSFNLADSLSKNKSLW